MSVCPHLRKRSEEEYICTRIGTTVNPFLAPCLSNYEECPFYKREEAPPSRREVALEEEEKKEEAVAKPEAPAIRRELSIEDRIEEFENEAHNLEKLWSAYEEAAKRVVDAWQNYRRELERRLASLNKEYEGYETILNEMETRKALGMIDEATYQRTMAELQAIVEKLKSNIERLEGVINHVDDLLVIHYKRIRPSVLKIPPSKIKLSLLKLDELYKRGEIDKKLYEKIRKELEEDYEMLIHYG